MSTSLHLLERPSLYLLFFNCRVFRVKRNFNMPEVEVINDVDCEYESLPKFRSLSTSSTDSMLSTESCEPERPMEIDMDGVKELFQEYDTMEGDDIPCLICGKHYKSKVCVKKHSWEHSIYWEMFDGLKKQQRVLSIQAAIILAIRSNPSLSLLLVTTPGGTKKKDKKSKSLKRQDSGSVSPRKRNREEDMVSCNYDENLKWSRHEL